MRAPKETLGKRTTEEGRENRCIWKAKALSVQCVDACADLRDHRNDVVAQKLQAWQNKVHVMFIYNSKYYSDTYSRARTINHSRG